MAVVPAAGAGPSDTADGSTDRPASVGERLLREQREAIAIVGVGLRFPGGNTTLDGFEEFLREGRSGVRPVPRDRWDVDAFTSDDPQVKGKIRAAGCGFLDGIDQFDASFFGISPLEAQYTDPQQRLLLETTWEALENANLNPGTLRHGNGGVYIGASSIDYAMELDSLSYEETDGHLATGITAFPMSGRLSYFLGWRGPSLSTDTACASSLTAVHLAVAGLRGRECDIAVAGAVNAIHHPKVLVMFSHANMLAPDGVCKTFDESADGYVRAEGCGVLILKRLSDAERDGDNVLALVRGTAIGQDGESAGLTVPNGSAQEAVMRKALANARLEPGDIQYVEAHGTGTPLGDPIEMGAISDVFMQSHTKAEPIAVASLKTNVGHMEPVAGIGGVVKTILQMRSGTIFPHLNFRVPSGRIPWDKIPVRVPTECLPWKADIRRAVVSSFGFAGSIAAAVIEEPAAAPPALAGADAADGSHVFTLSAKSKRSLRMLIERYQQFLVDHPQVSAADVCYTSNVGRAHFPMRVSGVVGDRVGLATLLDKQLERLDQSGGSASDIRKVAFLFTGQGSQYPGMGSALYRQFPVFRQHVDTCDELFGPHLGRSIKDLMFGTAADAEVIHQTRYTQPALFTLEYALAKLWISWGVRPNVMIGHSIGEVAAAAVAGLLTLPDAVLLVSARSRLMQSVTAPGGMAAVTAAAAQIVPLLAPYADLALAGLNSPSQCVVSGGRDSLANLTSVLEGQGIQVKQLAVSHAFHSPLMSEVSQAFGEALAQVRFYEPSLTLISNLTGQVAKPAQLATPDYWIRHIVEPVNFEAGMSTVDRRGKHAFVEIGPSRALTALARQCVNPQDHRWHASLDAKDLDGTVIRDSVAQVYAAGIPVSWTSFHQGREARKVALPAYAFDRKRYWLPMKGKRHGLGGSAPGGPAVHPLLGQEVSTPQQVASGIREFSARLSADSPEYLADHVVLGRVVFPGTGYLETLLALQDAVYGDTRRPILDVRVREPLFLALDEATDVRTRLLAAGPGPVAVEIVSRANGSDESVERTHVTAAFGDPELADVLTEAGRHLSAAAQNAGEPDETIGTDDVYAAYTAVGLQYGPAFRRMQKVARYGTDLAVGEMHGLDGGPVEHVPPAILDAATHAYAAIGDDGHSYLPVRYGWFRLFKKPRAQALRILLRTDPVCPDGVDISIDLLALEGDQPVFELRGLGLRRIADGAGGARPSLVHQLRWLRRSLIGQNAAEDRGILVAHCDPAYSAALAGLAPESCAVTFAADTQSAATSLREGQVTDVCWFWSGSPGETKPSVSSLRAECERNYRDLVEFLAMLGREGFGRNQRLWLVTEQAQWLPGDERGPDRPSAAATLWGFGHSLLNEYPAYRSTMIDLPGGEPGLRHLFEELGARATSEFQVAYREGHRRVRRLLPLDRAASGRDGSFELAIKEYGQFSDIKVIPAEQVPPRGDEIQVEVRAAGLNFKDVLNALGMLKEFGDQPLGFEAAGQVVAAGPDATHRVGDEVVINYLGCMKSSVTVPSAVAVPKPANLSFVQAAGLTSVYVTAYYALHTLVGMKAGDRVLIHAAAGGVGQAAVHLAQAAGAEVFATASPHKWPLLRSQGVAHIMNSRTLEFADEVAEITGGQGVDIVLNSLNKDFIPAGMKSLAIGGRFIEMGKVGAWTPEQVRQERPDVTYHNFDLSELPPDQAFGINAEIMQIIVDRVAAGELPPIGTTAYSLDEIDEAFGVLSRGANIGKLVLDFAAQAAGTGTDVAIYPGRTYLITGGLGGLGLVTARKLADLGARHIVLLSRRATPPDEVAHLVAQLRDRAEVTIQQGDVAVAADVSRVMETVRRSGYPLGGIIHAAGSLADAPVADQTWETIDAVFQSKVYGSWLLHKAAEAVPDLQFFVGYSSAAPVVGAPGQSNYAAANAFMDDLLLRRADRGLPGLTVNWGPWGEVGMSARLGDQVLKRWQEEGIRLISPGTGMRALIPLLSSPIAQAVVGMCDWNLFTAAKPVENALYQKLVRDDGAASAGIDLDALVAASRRDRTAAIEEFVRSKVAAVLHFDDMDAVDPGTEFVRLGLDSLMAVELKNVLEAAFRLPLPPTIALDYPSAELLTDFLERQLVPDLERA